MNFVCILTPAHFWVKKLKKFIYRSWGSIFQRWAMISIYSGYHMKVLTIVQGNVSRNFDMCRQWKIMRNLWLLCNNLFAESNLSLLKVPYLCNMVVNDESETHSPGEQNYLSPGASSVSICWIQPELSSPNLRNLRRNVNGLIGRREHTCIYTLAWTIPCSMGCEMTGILSICTCHISMDGKFGGLFDENNFECINWGCNANIWDFLIQSWNIFAILI